MWRVQKYIPLVCAKTTLTCVGPQTTPSDVRQDRSENGNSRLLFAVVQYLHQSNVYIERKLRVWRVQKCIPLVGAETALTCASLHTTLSDVRQHSPENGNSGLLFAMIPCLHQSNVHIKKKLRVWRLHKCIPLVGAKPHFHVRACKVPHLM